MQKIVMFILFFTIFNIQLNAQTQKEQRGWWNADRSPLGIAPKPENEKQAIVQIYIARAYSWRGYFAVHPWVSIKEKNADHYSSFEVMGFGGERGIPIIRTRINEPDRRWFGNDPELIFDLRGEAAEKMIPDIQAAVKSYAYPEMYRLFPGPNSNTFVSHIIRNTPGIYTEMPPHAIGKDWIGRARPVALSESGTGIQVSIFGLLGFTVGLAEGVEINLLGMNFGVDILRPALKLPFIGRLGFKDKPVFDLNEDEKNLDSKVSHMPSIKEYNVAN